MGERRTASDSEWRPNPKQERALTSPVPELFYGGAKGGGKSDFLLVDFLWGLQWGIKYQGVIFRRTYQELEELMQRAMVLYPTMGGSLRKTERTWVFPGGSTLKFRYLDIDQDVANYQGHQYCVAVGTLIEMADGSARPIESIEVGERVRTLEGPRRVTDKVRPYKAQCVRAMTQYGAQIHPAWHPILTTDGWQSYASLLDIDATEFEEAPQGFCKHPSVTVTAVLQAPSRGVYQQSAVPIGFHSRHRFCEPSSERTVETSRSAWGRLRQLVYAQSLRGCTAAPPCVDDSERGRPDSQIDAGYLCDYLPRRHLRDEPPLVLTENAQDGIPSQDDAGEPSPGHYRQDVPGSTHGYSPDGEGWYVHPYTGQARVVSEEMSFGSCEISPFGEALVCDITVEGANHYISYTTRLVNVNTWIGWDELTSWPTDYCYMFMFSCLRSPHGLPLRVRATGNPGMPGHLWIKNRFIDVAPPWVVYREPGAEGQIRERVFIPASLDDNPFLLHTEYESNLMNLPEHLYQAFRHGDWDVVVGQVFQEFRREKHVVRPFSIEPSWFRYASLDWGYAKPFAIGWWAVTHDGRLIMYKEWYGRGEKPNEGCRLEATEVAKESFNMSIREGCKDMVMDRACWNKQGTGRSVAQIFEAEGWNCVPSTSDRLNGLAAVHDRMQTIGFDGQPMMLVFDCCPDWIRTVPILSADPRHPEDVDTMAEDHHYDQTRYSCLSDFSRRRVDRKPRPRYHGMEAQTGYDPLEWQGFDPIN